MSNPVGMSTRTPDKKLNKKPALPSLLSNLRNAQAVIGRAATDTTDIHEREVRPLVSSRPQLQQRNASTSSSLSSTLQNFSQRFESNWRKRAGRRKSNKGSKGVTIIIPQGFYLAVGCFFFAFPILFIIFILARHAVFGDEADSSEIHNHEVPKHDDSLQLGTNSNLEDIMNVIDNNEVENEIQGVGYIAGNNETSIHAIDSDIMIKGDPQEVLAESATNDLQYETQSDHEIGDDIDQSEGVLDPVSTTNDMDIVREETTTMIQNSTAEVIGEDILSHTEEVNSGDGVVNDKEPSELIAAKVSGNDELSTNKRMKLNEKIDVEDEASHGNLRQSPKPMIEEGDEKMVEDVKLYKSEDEEK